MDSPMTSVDGFISGHAAGHGALVVLLLAFALGLRHASDPDHLVAVSTLVADTPCRAARAAARLGAAWGLGHAATAFALGVVHGTAGSAGVAVLLIAAIPSTTLACVALVILVLGCALSMALMSAAVGGALNAATARRRVVRAIPVLGSLALAFGAWYVVVALQSL